MQLHADEHLKWPKKLIIKLSYSLENYWRGCDDAKTLYIWPIQVLVEIIYETNNVTNVNMQILNDILRTTDE